MSFTRDEVWRPQSSDVFRACLDERGLDFVAVNDITDAETLAHLSVRLPFTGR